MKLFLALLLISTLSLQAEPAVSNDRTVSLFDGKTLAGWQGNPKLWRISAGVISGGSLSEKVAHNDFLVSERSYQNFDLRLKIKLSGTEGFINSGVQIRSVRLPGSTEMSGYQIDAGDQWWGKLYDESRRKKVIGEPADPEAVNRAIKKDDWNEFRIRAEGPRIQTWINGVPALDYTEADPTIPQDGYLGLQIHGGGKALAEFKDLTIEELAPTAGAPTWSKAEPAAKPAAPAP
ncbi:MAG TPA: DUF1080 domain-containing protein [Chthoniobacteraceae bacterium]|jgi:hypothetical protein